MQEKGGAFLYDTKESLMKDKEKLNTQIVALQAKIKVIDSKLATYDATKEQLITKATENVEKPWYRRWTGFGGKKTAKRRRSNKK